MTCTFGIWLIGFFLLLTVGEKDNAFTPDAIGWYTLILIIPVVIFAVPEFVHRNVPLMIAFAAIIVLLLLLGLGFHDLNNDVVTATLTKRPPDLSGVANMLKISASMGFIAAAAIWYVMARDLYRIVGIFGMAPPPWCGGRNASVDECSPSLWRATPIDQYEERACDVPLAEEDLAWGTRATRNAEALELERRRERRGLRAARPRTPVRLPVCVSGLRRVLDAHHLVPAPLKPRGPRRRWPTSWASRDALLVQLCPHEHVGEHSRLAL